MTLIRNNKLLIINIGIKNYIIDVKLQLLILINFYFYNILCTVIKSLLIHFS